jgi:hypothetical protein
MVSIVAFQAVDPGSIPGPRTFYRSADLNRQVLLPRVAVEAKSPRRDSNPQSLPPEGSALSIRPQGHHDT